MKYRHLGRAGTKVSALSLGGWLTYGNSVDETGSVACFKRAVERGVNFIDVADVYAGGQAETVLGQFLKQVRRADLVISSKVFFPISENVNNRGLSRKHIRESIDQSLKRLGTDYLDIYFCHRFDPETPLDETVRAMSDLVTSGKILYWGTSMWSADQLKQAHQVAKEYGGYAPQVEQPVYNLVSRDIEQEVIPMCKQLGMGVTVFSPLGQGLLTGKYNEGRPAGSRGAGTSWLDRYLTEDNLKRVRQFSALAKELDVTTSQLALAWILQREEISSAIVGASKPEQLDETLKAVDVKIPAEVSDRISKIFG